jgi:glyoxylase-like metal-dependent hydrolase (beta-lactamase superfamily II)
MGDTFFNGMYPYIDPGTGGKITGMISASGKILSLAGNDTKIVPGHGPLGNKADLTKFRDMLITSRDRVQKLKSAGKSAQEAVGKAVRRSGPRLGQRHHQQRPVRPSRLSDALSLRLSIFVTSNPLTRPCAP